MGVRIHPAKDIYRLIFLSLCAFVFSFAPLREPKQISHEDTAENLITLAPFSPLRLCVNPTPLREPNAYA